MKIVNKKLSIKEFEKYVAKKDFGTLPPTFLVIHHTYRPTVKTWNGSRTIQGLKTFYEAKGWSAGPHLFIAEDGIWLFTDMYDVGIHAGTGNGTLKSGYSIGIEVVGNYDNKVWSGKTKENTLAVVKALQGRLNITKEEIHFHRDYSAKSCPGHAITKKWLFNQLNATMYKIDSKLRDSIEDITEKEYKDKMGSEKIQEEVAKDLSNVWKAISNGFNSLKLTSSDEIRGLRDKVIKKEEKLLAVNKLLKEKIDEKPEIVYIDNKETLEKLANKNQEVIDLKIALSKRSVLYKLMLDAKRLLIKIWGLIV